ncbi:MAG: succinate dehydrogenase, hydrophobic membrane anchor protein [Gammaproteobacteria bacterium]|nr:succinate dehydrogenase, hydrophobic membrane anchor protein [Gammaproteobacteria bacterium]MCP4088807.1 succinate dehydrogenase, hydrophobic membrane anchor protein [Gammaproteobacteria bacterium]MCP4275894.1 succinate dehydrogenase, hydrophobic membrane anchor protein [Gammaproteobacteria bacterium]MCP4832110.1 succinate dehydrogenase, hydrophobic membrane anchor protein [Gammaproteobacteria bacterium]MCP4928289.1 succinate dehydrogenase, hydrophobic membrane anchor protein [Gammaproteobac
MSFESPLGKFLGHGSAKEGTGHFISQRLTAVALIPLTVWFVFALLGLSSLEYANVIAWVAQPLNAILLVLLLGTLLHHSQLGLQVVVEDYVHTEWLKVITLMVFKFIHIGMGVAGIYALIVISVGGMAS